MRFYSIEDDLSLEGRWFLQGPVTPSGLEVDPRRFITAEPFSTNGSLRIPLRYKGTPLGFTFADFDMPVVSSKVGQLISSVCGADVQRFPANVDGSAEHFEILNVLCKRPCLDEARSRSITKWTENDGRPDKVGQLRMVIGLRIDPTAVANHHAFRIDGWEIALIASERLKTLLEKHMVSGITF